MTDAISRSAVLEALESEKGRVMAEKWNDWPFTGEILARAVDTARAFIKDTPTLDIAPVVRCKDCKSFMPYTKSYRKASGFDGACAILAGFTDCDKECVHETDFCSRGARMDGDADAD